MRALELHVCYTCFHLSDWHTKVNCVRLGMVSVPVQWISASLHVWLRVHVICLVRPPSLNLRLSLHLKLTAELYGKHLLHGVEQEATSVDEQVLVGSVGGLSHKTASNTHKKLTKKMKIPHIG